MRYIWRLKFLLMSLRRLCLLLGLKALAVPAVLTVGIILLIWTLTHLPRFMKRIRRNKRYLNSGINTIDRMDGIEFEHFLLYHYKRLGYRGRATPPSGDFGADLVLSKKHEKIVLQAKRWSKNIGVSAVQEITAAKSYYHADRAIVVTNRYFTKSASELAKANNVELWDRDTLLHMLSVSKNKGKANTCPLCGSALVRRVSKDGRAFYGCSRFPECHYTKGI